ERGGEIHEHEVLRHVRGEERLAEGIERPYERDEKRREAARERGRFPGPDAAPAARPPPGKARPAEVQERGRRERREHVRVERPCRPELEPGGMGEAVVRERDPHAPRLSLMRGFGGEAGSGTACFSPLHPARSTTARAARINRESPMGSGSKAGSKAG